MTIDQSQVKKVLSRFPQPPNDQSPDTLDTNLQVEPPLCIPNFHVQHGDISSNIWKIIIFIFLINESITSIPRMAHPGLKTCKWKTIVFSRPKDVNMIRRTIFHQTQRPISWWHLFKLIKAEIIQIDEESFFQTSQWHGALLVSMIFLWLPIEVVKILWIWHDLYCLIVNSMNKE